MKEKHKRKKESSTCKIKVYDIVFGPKDRKKRKRGPVEKRRRRNTKKVLRAKRSRNIESRSKSRPYPYTGGESHRIEEEQNVWTISRETVRSYYWIGRQIGNRGMVQEIFGVEDRM